MADDVRRNPEDDLWITYVPSWPELEEIFMEKLDMSPEEFRELTDEAKGWAFSVAKIQTAQVLARAKAKLGQIILSGGDVADFIAWVETSGFQWSEAYSTLVGRMAILPTYGLARYQEINSDNSKLDFPYLMYDAINDNRVRPEHLAMDNRVWHRDQFPSEWWPPNGYNCNHWGNRIRVESIEAVFRRPYSGPILSLETAGGREVLVTPNHPVATSRGFLPAHELKVGMKIVVDPDPVDGIGGLGAECEEDDLPPTIHEVFCAALEVVGSGSASREGLAAGLDFHGDVFPGQCEVEVVRPDRPLSLSDLSEAIKNIRNLGLSESDCLLSEIGPCSDSSGDHLVPLGSAHGLSGGEGGLRHAFALFGAHLGASGAIRGVDSIEEGVVGSEHGSLGPSPELDAFESGADPVSGFPRGFGDAEYRLPAEVSLDDLVSIRLMRLDGHVYNLQSSTHTYYSNSILTGNCRCSVRQLDDYLLQRSGGVLQNDAGAPLVDGQQVQPDKGFRANQMEAYAAFLEAKRQEAEDKLKT